MYLKIVQWYQKNKRDLIFRKYTDPYAIWVSEIMAQQTQIETMLPYFERWMKKYPTISSCASAHINEVLKMWEGLGYYRRAKLLHQGCNYVLKNHSGIFPTDYIDIHKIPGIGEYTAAALYSIVFNGKKAAIDGNVIRIVSRVNEIQDNSASVKTKKKITEIVEGWMSDCVQCNYSDFTQGLMEIGALICTPKNPKCIECPLKEECLAFTNETQLNYPVKVQKKVSPVLEYDVLIIEKDNKLLVTENWSDGLMIGLTRLPQIDRSQLYTFNIIDTIGEMTHIFSHKKWLLTIHVCAIDNAFEIPSSWRWLNIEDINITPFITAHKKIITNYFNNLV